MRRLKQKRKKITKKILNKQIKAGLKNIKNNKKIIIAYEPVWSIGTGLYQNLMTYLRQSVLLKKEKKIIKFYMVVQ